MRTKNSTACPHTISARTNFIDTANRVDIVRKTHCAHVRLSILHVRTQECRNRRRTRTSVKAVETRMRKRTGALAQREPARRATGRPVVWVGVSWWAKRAMNSSRWNPHMCAMRELAIMRVRRCVAGSKSTRICVCVRVSVRARVCRCVPLCWSVEYGHFAGHGNVGRE